ncbi:hypothetical protein PilKf_01627 [Pillotina sp. SPG140]|jgi:DNA modification methylase
MTANKLILGDNLEILKTLDSDSVDLIYLDPPFFSNHSYTVMWGDAGETQSFEDRLHGGIDQYIAWLKERVEHMHRVLKPTGSLFLHCDWRANAYIRVEILDKIFGAGNFRNEIIWSYKTGGASKRMFARKHDMIYFYSKTETYTFNLQKEKSYMMYKYGFKKTDFYIDKKNGLQYSMVYSRDILEIPSIGSATSERVGYPLQKPEALVKRIINCASNEGDLILDPFMGGGTTIAVADHLKRRWIGIDQSAQAVKVSEFRLQKQANIQSAPFTVQLHKYDYDTLKNSEDYAFERWIIEQFGGTAHPELCTSAGYDGKRSDGALIHVNRHDNVGQKVIDSFKSAIERHNKKLLDRHRAENKAVGYIIAFSFDRTAVEAAAQLKNQENIIIQLVPVEDIIPVARRPTVTVQINELSKARTVALTATGNSNAGIGFYSWDFEFDEKKGFKPSVIIDKAGRQHRTFKTGMQTVAVKAVDNNGLETVAAVTVTLRGTEAINDLQ